MSVAEMIVQTCQEADNCSDSTRERNTPGWLRRHDSKNEAWHHNQAQNSDNEKRYPYLCVVEASRGCLDGAVVSDRGRLDGCFQVFALQGVRRLFLCASKLFSGMRNWWFVDSLELVRDWLGGRLVNAGPDVCGCVDRTYLRWSRGPLGGPGHVPGHGIITVENDVPRPV